MTGELRNKITLITGAAAGIGRSAALLFAREGARLMLADIDEAAALRLAEEIEAAGGEAAAVAADVSREDDVARLMAAVEGRYGGLDCAFNNAGIGHQPLSLLNITLEHWNRYLTVNLTGTFLCMKYEIPMMLARGGGSIVNTGSLAGLAATPKMGSYTASKFGLTGITKSASAEFVSQNIRINAVCPTATATEAMRSFITDQGLPEERMSGPMGRMGRPEEIAEAALWLLSERASFVTGQALITNGGSPGQTA